MVKEVKRGILERQRHLFCGFWPINLNKNQSHNKNDRPLLIWDQGSHIVQRESLRVPVDAVGVMYINY